MRRLGFEPGISGLGPEQYACIHIKRYERASEEVINVHSHGSCYSMADMKGQDSRCYYLSHDDQCLFKHGIMGYVRVFLNSVQHILLHEALLFHAILQLI